MAPLPRIMTIDPAGGVAKQVRAAIDLMDRIVIQIDIPNADEALQELQRAACNVVVANWHCGENLVGWELAGEIKRLSPETAVIVLGDYSAPAFDDDDDMLSSSPFVYLRRPFEVETFLRALRAALEGGDVFAALKPVQPVQIAAPDEDFGPVPDLNLNRAADLLDVLQRELNSLAILLMTREGNVLLEHGAQADVNLMQLAHTLAPAIISNLRLKHVVGGNATTLQFYDGEEYDVFVVSVGLHHFLCILFDGERGARQLGIVSRYGRRTAEDLIALMGAQAWMLMRPVVVEEPPQQARTEMPARAAWSGVERTEPDVDLEPAELLDLDEPPAQPVQPEETVPMAAIPDLDVDRLFAVDVDEGADLFDDIDALAQIARDEQRSDALSMDQATELGLINR